MARTPPPWIPWHPLAWLGDLALQRCDNYAKGVWIQMLMVMHQSEVPGVLWSDGEPWSDERVARTVNGGTVEDNIRALETLKANGVARKYPEGHRYAGAYFSKRLIAEVKARAAEMQKNARKMKDWRGKKKDRVLPSRNGNVTVTQPSRYSNTTDIHTYRTNTTAAAAMREPVAAVAAAPAAGISLDSQTLKARIAFLRKRPEWLPEGKPWIDGSAAHRIAKIAGDGIQAALTMDDINDVFRAAKDSRHTLDNPAGFVIKTLLEIANTKGTHAPQPNHATQ